MQQALFLAKVDEDVAVGIEDFGFGDEAEIAAMFVHDRQVPRTGVFEDFHHFFHRHIGLKDGRR